MEDGNRTYHGRIIPRLKRALKRHGLVGVVRATGENIVSCVSKLTPSVRAERARRKQEEAAFDKALGVDTGGWIHQTELDARGDNQVHATSYAGSNPRLFRAAMRSLPIDFRCFVFVDFGSGKGRAVLLATEFSFKKIVGIEFCEELHTVAQSNVRNFRRDMAKSDNIELLCMDVTDYILPADCLVCYFCNPFDAPLMKKVVLNIRQSYLGNPREIFVVYHNPYEAHVIDEMHCFQAIVGTDSAVRTWKTVL